MLRNVLLLAIIPLLAGCPNGPFSSQENPYEGSSPVVPNDTLYAGDQWYLDLVNAPEAWAILDERSIEPATLAIIDKLPYALHEDLETVYTEDGMDFVGGTATPLVFPDPATPISGTDHGNHVTGIAAAIAENEIGIAGLAYNTAERSTVRVMPLAMLDTDGYGTIGDLVAAMLYAAGLDSGRGVFPDEPADVISMSLGASTVTTVEEAFLHAVIEAISDRGIIMVAAAGNDGVDGVDYPAAFSQVVAVGSVDASRVLAGSSNYGSELDIVAPGEGIVSTVYADGYEPLSGTSMSTPFVSATAALVRALVPTLTAETIVDLLLSNAADLGTAGFDELYGHGLLDVHGTIAGALVINPFEGAARSEAASSSRSLGVRIRRIVAEAAESEGTEDLWPGRPDLLVLFDPDVTATWTDAALEFERLAALAGIEWRTVPGAAAPLVGEARPIAEGAVEEVIGLLSTEPAVLLVSGNRMIVR